MTPILNNMYRQSIFTVYKSIHIYCCLKKDLVYPITCFLQSKCLFPTVYIESEKIYTANQYINDLYANHIVKQTYTLVAILF